MSIRIGSPTSTAGSSLRSSAQNRADEKKAFEKLSSGKRINRAADDAAGLAIAEGMSAELRGLEQGMKNVYDGISMVSTADAGLEASGDQLLRMRELAVSAANDVLSPQQRDAVQAEFDSLYSEVDREAASLQFNDKKVLDGSAGQVEIGVGMAAAGGPEKIVLDFSRNMDAASLGLGTTRLDGPDGSNARAAIDDIDAALAKVNAQRAELGAASNRLSSAHQGLAVAAENTTASRSRITDTDYAVETAELTRKQIMAHVGDAVTVQGRLMPSSVMSLLNK